MAYYLAADYKRERQLLQSALLESSCPSRFFYTGSQEHTTLDKAADNNADSLQIERDTYATEEKVTQSHAGPSCTQKSIFCNLQTL